MFASNPINSIILPFVLLSAVIYCYGVPVQRLTDRVVTVAKQTAPASDMELLAEGPQSTFKEPFVAVVRDAETYAVLREMDGASLPNLDEEFFKSRIAIAAFLGERNRGGFSVDIRDELGGYVITEQQPENDVMVPQMITSPFKIVAVRARLNRIRILVEEPWEKRMQAYRLISGSFVTSGGFAPSMEEYPLGGSVRVMRLMTLATFHFSIHDASRDRGLVSGLSEFATGIVKDNGSVDLSRLSASTLTHAPLPSGLRVAGSFRGDDKQLWFNLSLLPSKTTDGYFGQGKFEAELVGSADKP